MFTTTDAVGLTLFGSGLLFEIIADRQKSVWVVAKKNKEHDEAFLTTGLWSRSRHPNYFGEITLWSGIAVTCWGVLSSPVGLRSLGANAMGMGGGGKALAAAICVTSPAFVTFLLTKVSGIPLSEGKYDRKFGHRADYCRWKRETPVLIPRLVVVRQVPSE